MGSKESRIWKYSSQKNGWVLKQKCNQIYQAVHHIFYIHSRFAVKSFYDSVHKSDLDNYIAQCTWPVLLLLISLTYLQLLSGSECPIMNQEYCDYGAWIESSWLTSLWAFLSRVKYKLYIAKQWLPMKPRQNGFSLMDHFLQLSYSNVQLGTLNRCRLYLQAINLSDITSADGTIIIPACKQGRRLID
jgi:hypothetical protein